MPKLANASSPALFFDYLDKKLNDFYNRNVPECEELEQMCLFF
ncbi:hypothetical protein KsCSTR_26650 [Candidatus Kuenenia stuttgartiensis]|uniref:Uncharacterized protein n=1 Tax=Kuenenia stuttgartiensis TaxID=174633 RepID=A0A6G7GRQ9_KUEST|nr:hypothetical protein KsCSTR_26650 [Candidatus Kuenenia stuttgartiensis]